MPQLLLLRGAEQVLSLRGPWGVRRGAALRDLGVINDGAVLIRDGLVAAVGSTRRIENLREASTAIEVPANGRIVVPGFVDPNVALSVASGAEAEKNFRKRKRVTEFSDECLSLLRSCLQHGTLTADLKASGGDHERSLDLPALRKLADIGGNPISTVRTWHLGETGEQHASESVLMTLAVIARKKLAHSVEFNAGTQSQIDMELLKALAGAGMAIKLAWRGGVPEALMICLEQFCPQAVYCAAPVLLSSREISVLAACSGITVLGAGREVFEGPSSRIGRELIDGGAAIALSSGYDSASGASFSMQMALSLAVVRLGLTIEEAFSAATINAAYAAGRGGVTGSIEVGKQADLLLLNASDYRDIPAQFGVNHVDLAIRGGTVVLNRTRWKAMTN